MPIDRNRATELEYMLRKMGGIISVFEVRSEPVENALRLSHHDGYLPFNVQKVP